MYKTPSNDILKGYFNAIAPHYDLTNLIMSLGLHTWWMKRAASFVDAKDKHILDLCCGTGKMGYLFQEKITFVDFSKKMIAIAKAKDKDHTHTFIQADVTQLPLENDSFDLALCSFGVRNIGQLEAFFSEAHRVLKQGGELLVLELTRPKNPLLLNLYKVYLSLLPHFIKSKKAAYTHLKKSVLSFLDPNELEEIAASHGLYLKKRYAFTFHAATCMIFEKR